MTEKAFSPIGYTMNGKFNRFVILLFCLTTNDNCLTPLN